MPKSSKRWLQRQNRDPFVKRARAGEYRARSVYKLVELDQAEKLLRPGHTVVDLGAAPGSWSQYARDRVGPGGTVIAVDCLPMMPIAGVTIIEGDFSDMEVLNRCIASLNGALANLVMSDMAPNLTGIRATDQARSLHLAELAFDFAGRVLCEGGDLLLKVFQGEGSDEFRKELMERFQKVMVKKPRASRDASREFYVLARGYDV